MRQIKKAAVLALMMLLVWQYSRSGPAQAYGLNAEERHTPPARVDVAEPLNTTLAGVN